MDLALERLIVETRPIFVCVNLLVYIFSAGPLVGLQAARRGCVIWLAGYVAIAVLLAVMAILVTLAIW